jgi:2-dehydropantoate 2-reductase
MRALRVLVIGAGVIGRIHACRLVDAGHEVTVLARGDTATELASQGITLCEGSTCTSARVRVVETVPEEFFDFILIAVRRDQSAAAIDVAATVPAGVLVPMFNNPLGLGSLRERCGADRVIGAFPGVGGYIAPDGTVHYLRIRQQPATVECRGGREEPLVQALAEAGFRVERTNDMDAWLATHGVFVLALSAALARADYSLPRLTADHIAMRTMVRAVRDGFHALEVRGITITPPGLSTIFTRIPVAFAAYYWSRLLRGPLGEVAVLPHARATRDTEMAVLRADIAELIPPGAAPRFDHLLS